MVGLQIVVAHSFARTMYVSSHLGPQHAFCLSQFSHYAKRVFFGSLGTMNQVIYEEATNAF